MYVCVCLMGYNDKVKGLTEHFSGLVATPFGHLK